MVTGSGFMKIDLHGKSQDEAMRIIDRAISQAGPAVYQIQLIHGYHRGTALRSMIHDWYRYEPKVRRIVPGDNPGITILILRELY
ncbi:MAG: Smr/MutS family protein [Eubacterium sp.]|nr:Smr/MutS family protein [Eubacterium sp.]